MKLYVIVDYENDFVDGSLGFPGAEKLDEGIVARGQQVLAEGGQIVEIHDTHHSDYLETREGRTLPVEHAIYGTLGWAIYGKTGEWLKTFPHTLIMKSTFGVAPDIMLQLPDDVEEIEIVGLVTNMCVISCACVFQARYPNAQIYVHESLVASFNKELHEQALNVMEGMQIKIIRG